MMIRFRTRLSLTVSLLIILAVSGMAVVVSSLFAARTGMLYYSAGEQLNHLADVNIEHGLSLPAKVMDRVADQMAVQALLIGELVALAERGPDAQKVSVEDLLRRVRERSQSLRGYPLLDEVWVTDEKGAAVVRPDGAPPFNFLEAAAEDGQVAPFLGLLDAPLAPPVVQGIRPRAMDEKPFRYAGAGGVDRPRIVQVGVGQDLTKSIVADFDVQNTVERFMVGMNFERIIVVDGDGRVVAASGAPQVPGQGIADDAVRAYCAEFLESGEPFRSKLFKGDVGVVTALRPADGPPMALFIQHQTSAGALIIYQYVLFVAAVGLAAIVLSVIATMLLSRGLSQPLEALMRGARELGAGNLDHRITLTRNDEFKNVAQAFNHMAASLRRQVAELRQQTADRERFDSELRIAAEVQMMLLPDAPPQLAGYRMAGLCRPAKTVGGDFYDFVPMTDGACAVVLGDATGKGMPAALLTTQCSSMLRTLAGEFQEPGELLRRTNRELHRRIGQTCRFVTIFCMCVEPENSVVRYAVAGHNPPLIALPDGTVRRVDCVPAFPLGLRSNTLYGEGSLELPIGAALLIYSDGVTDARRTDGETFGEDRLAALLAEAMILHPEDATERIAAAVQNFCGTDDVFDDMTLVLVRRDGESPAADGAAVLVNVP
jgi:serine phosphatase RsbU (regulator of sigma subunit)